MRSSSRLVQGWRGWGRGICSWPAAHLPPVWQVLIGDEPERGMENLLEVQVPKDVEQQLQQLDCQEQEQLEREQEREQERELELAPEPWVERATPT